MNTSAITFAQVTKKFRIPHERRSTLREHFIGLFRPLTYEMFCAVDRMTIEVSKGEFLGVIGMNGSGKSTFLRLIAGIYPLHEGHISVQGRIAPFLELGAGFQPELSGRENIYLYAALLGLTRRQIHERYHAIVAYADMVRFMDQRVKNYSSGMQARLAFAISIHVNADILLVDEVLAVGDADFQERCFETFRKLKKEGKTIIFVSHDLLEIKRFSNRVLWMDYGKIRMLGNPHQVVSDYEHTHV